ncbi:hypothetical protein PMAYCL1PPCAC_08985, partial [Pristionchus mayeri]
ISELCFVRRQSSVRRDVIAVAPTISQIDCNIKCVYTPGCESCMFYSDKGNCVMLTAASASPPGQCPSVYVCFEKSTTGCPVRTSVPVDLDFTPGSCVSDSDIIGPPEIRVAQPCGMSADREKRAIYSAMLHDGTRITLENSKYGFIGWNPYLG